MLKKNVYKHLIVGIALLIMFINPVNVKGYVLYDEVVDTGIVASLEGMRTFQVHYTNWLFYTINVDTPGFIETGVYNSRKKRGDKYVIDYFPFSRWRAGPVVETGNELDVYIDASSRGFFVVQLPNSSGLLEMDGFLGFEKTIGDVGWELSYFRRG